MVPKALAAKRLVSRTVIMYIQKKGFSSVIANESEQAKISSQLILACKLSNR